MFGHERYRGRVCIGSLHPSNDYSFHATRKLRPIEARRGSKGAATTVVRCFHVHYGSRREISVARGWWRFVVASRDTLAFDRIYPTERVSCFATYFYTLGREYFVGEFSTIKEDRELINLGGRDYRWINFWKSDISLKKNYAINPFSSDQTTFILIFLLFVRTRESG